MADKPVYIGNCKTHFFENGKILNGSISLDKVKNDYITESKGKKYLNFSICENKEGENEYGNTHYIKLNTWKPKEKKEPESEGLPFG